MQTAYDPVRVRRLAAQTTTAIEALAVIRSSDPDAADALRSVRLLRRNLEELWMPLLHQILTSTAMIEWTASAWATVASGQAMIVDWIADHVADSKARYAALTDEELYALTLRNNEDGPFDAVGGLDLDDSFWSTTFPPLADELARRVRVDPEFARWLVDSASANPLIGLAVGEADFPPSFVYQATLAMLHDTSWWDDPGSRGEAAAADTLLTALLANPGLCLDVLGDPIALHQLAGWPLLDQGVVESVVHAGLYSAVAADPSRLADGYGTIRGLVTLANDELNDGFNTGMSRGLATSMVGYVDTFVPAIGISKEDGGIVQVDTFGDSGFSVELGDYEEVRNLFGAIARDVEAQAALGVTLGVYVNHATADLGADIDSRSTLAHAAQFADLIGDAVTAEQAEMVAAAAAETMRRESVGNVIGFGVTAVATASGVGAVGRIAISQVVRMGTKALTTVEPDAMPNGLVRHVTHDAIVVAAVKLARSDRPTQLVNQLDDDDRAARDAVDVHLERLDSLAADGDLVGYEKELIRMRTRIAGMPNLDAFVTDIVDEPAVALLAEGHT